MTLNLPGQAYAVFVRSRHAHGHLLSIDAAAARTMPGILGVFVQQRSHRRRIHKPAPPARSSGIATARC